MLFRATSRDFWGKRTHLRRSATASACRFIQDPRFFAGMGNHIRFPQFFVPATIKRLRNGGRGISRRAGVWYNKEIWIYFLPLRIAYMPLIGGVFIIRLSLLFLLLTRFSLLFFCTFCGFLERLMQSGRKMGQLRMFLRFPLRKKQAKIGNGFGSL